MVQFDLLPCLPPLAVRLGICHFFLFWWSIPHFRSCRRGWFPTPKLLINLIYIHANSPRYDTNLPVSRMGHHISQIKSSFELFCALVWNVAHFLLKTWIFHIHSTVSGAFLQLFYSHWQRLFLASKWWSWILTVCTSCKTSYNVLSHSHIYRGEGGVGSENERVSRF